MREPDPETTEPKEPEDQPAEQVQPDHPSWQEERRAEAQAQGRKYRVRGTKVTNRPKPRKRRVESGAKGRPKPKKRRKGQR